MTKAEQRDIQKACESERERLHQAFLSVFAGAGELWFPYYKPYSPDMTKEYSIEVADEYWTKIIDAYHSELDQDNK